MKKQILYPILLCLTFIFASCGSSGDGIPESTTSLTASQQEAVAEVLSEGGNSAAGAAVFALTVSQDYNETVDCEMSGSFTLKGDVDYSFNESTYDFDGKTNLKQTFNDCELLTSENEQVILNGTVKSKTSFDIDSDEQAANVSGTLSNKVTGGIDVTGADVEEGVCGIDTESTFLINNTTSGSISYSGQICGNSFSGTFDLDENY